MVKHFDLVFIHHSVGRLSTAERGALFPISIKGIGRDSSAAGLPLLFNIILRLLLDVKLPPRGSKEDDDFREAIGLSRDPSDQDAALLARWLGKLLLLRLKAGPKGSPGLTSADETFLTRGKKDAWDGPDMRLADVRLKAVQFLASGAFNDAERFIPALYAASNADSRISELGEWMLKRSSVDLEDRKVVELLFAEHKKLPAPFRIYILSLLSKSAVSTEYRDDILDVFQRNSRIRSPQEDEYDAAGLEQAKVHRALFEYVNWVARVSARSNSMTFKGTAEALIEMLQLFIGRQGWPKPTVRLSPDDAVLRSRAYETVGLLVRASLDSSTINVAYWLFTSLTHDPTPDVVVNIDGALATLSSCLRPPLDPVLASQLRQLIVGYTLADEDEEGSGLVRSARHAAVKWANNCFPFCEVVARWIDIMAVAGRTDERSDVIEEGQRGLDPWTHFMNAEEKEAGGPGQLPGWRDLVDVFFTDIFFKTPPVRGKPGATQSIDWHGGMDVDARSISANFPGAGLRAFALAVDYSKKILFLTALGRDYKIEPGWERQLEILNQSDKKSGQIIRAYLKSVPEYGGALQRLLTAAFDGMIRDDAAAAMQCARTFVDIGSLAPRSALEDLASKAPELLALVKSNKKELRVLGAKAYGILAAHPARPAELFEADKRAFWDLARDWKTVAAEGAFLASAHLVSRRFFYKTEPAGGHATPWLQDLVPTLDAVSSTTLSFQETIFETYTQLWTAGIQIPDPASSHADVTDLLTTKYIDPLMVQAKKGSERAIRALGRLALAFPSATEPVLEKLYSLYEIKQAEVHFAVGEAIAAAVACWDAEVVQLTLDVDTDTQSFGRGQDAAAVTSVMEKLLTDCKQTKPSLLKASGIWLFCLVQNCSHLDEVQSRLREAQVAFMRLLSARDELVQETASRGLALVYEKGDEALKGELVRDLVSSFTGTGTRLKVDEETELFDAGALPTGEGKSITSYKDIVNLANEVGDQSLVYKFMSLATNAATWSTRSAFGRFGLSNILSESEVDPKLYPKLYRYRFDPNRNVQRSMNDIWRSLVRDSNAVLEAHFDTIMDDLLKSILGREWRVREASCAALGDLISGRPFPKYEKYYKDIWAAALKVMDDVKSTVRAAAMRLCMGLTTTLERQLEDGSSGAAATAMINEAIPFLLSDRVIESSVDDVKLFATHTVIQITKKSGKALVPFVAAIITRLLGLFSTIEPDAINYYYQRSGEESREKIDKLRSRQVGRSPLMEGIEACLAKTEGTTLVELAPALESTIKTAVGMPTKIGCSHVLMTLATRHATAFAPFIPRFLALLETRGLLDRNDEVSQGYARAAAHLFRAATDDAPRRRLAGALADLYLDAEDETRRAKVADALAALAGVAADAVAAVEVAVVPLALVARCDEDAYVATQAGRAVGDGDEQVAQAAARRLREETVALAGRCLDSARWPVRHAGALAVAGCVEAATREAGLTGAQGLDGRVLRVLWPAYERALAMKTFARKERVLAAFPDFVKRAERWWRDEDPQGFGEAVRKVALREAGRRNEAYRPHAFEALGRFAAVRTDLDMLEAIWEVVGECVLALAEGAEENEHKGTAGKGPDAMDVDAPKPRGPDLASEAAWAAVAAVVGGYNREAMRTDPAAVLGRVASLLSDETGRAYVARAGFDRLRRGVWYACVQDIMAEAAEGVIAGGDGGGDGGEKTVRGGRGPLRWFLSTLDLERAEMGTEEQRLARTRAVRAVVELGDKLGPGTSGERLDGQGEVRGKVETALEEERSAVVQQGWRDVLAVLGG